MSATNLDIARAINRLVPNAAFGISDGNLSTLVWYDERPQPSVEDIQTQVDALLAAEPLRLLREERNRRISETDWWVLPDLTPTDDQLAYRQALRDITNIYTSLDDVVWPTNPMEAV